MLGCPKCVSTVVGSHHGVPAESVQDLSWPQKDIAFYENYYGDDKENVEVLQDIWQTISDMALDYAGFLDVSELPDIDRSSQMLLSGLLIMADWLTSNTELFPLLSVEDLKPDDKLRAERAWAKLDFPQMWNPERSVISNEDFKETFGFEPRSVQSEVLKIVENSENPGIYIFEAPMGCGKTETSLAASEILASKCGKTACFLDFQLRQLQTAFSQEYSVGLKSNLQNFIILFSSTTEAQHSIRCFRTYKGAYRRRKATAD